MFFLFSLIFGQLLFAKDINFTGTWEGTVGVMVPVKMAASLLDAEFTCKLSLTFLDTPTHFVVGARKYECIDRSLHQERISMTVRYIEGGTYYYVGDKEVGGDFSDPPRLPTLLGIDLPYREILLRRDPGEPATRFFWQELFVFDDQEYWLGGDLYRKL